MRGILMYDDKIAEVFLENQLKLYPEEVAYDIEEAREFLEESMAVIADSVRDVENYLDDVGVDTEGLSVDDILNMPEIFEIGDGRYLILEI